MSLTRTGAIALSLLCAQQVNGFVANGVRPSPPVLASSRFAASTMVATAEEVKGKGDEGASFDTTIDTIPKCPETKWDAAGLQFESLKPVTRTLPVEINAANAVSGMSEEEYFSSQKDAIKEALTAGGAIWFRGFELMQTKEGFQKMYELLELDPCQDPLASVGARAVVSKKGAMYEAVNKPSRAKFFVGMHNESTFKRTNRLGAFVCFKPADKGGEFLLLDGQKVLQQMEPGVRQRMYEKKVRFSNAELPFFDFLRGTPEPVQQVLKPVFKTVADFAVGQKIDMELDLRWDENDQDGLRLQALSPEQSPINRHPITGEPAWFCNVHSHSRFLRDRRDGDLPESSGASKLNVTNIYFGDLTEISQEDLDHIDKVTMDNLVKVSMQKGDVVLVDNYQVMHGRDVFEGTRMHAVTWFQ